MSTSNKIVLAQTLTVLFSGLAIGVQLPKALSSFFEAKVKGQDTACVTSTQTQEHKKPAIAEKVTAPTYAVSSVLK